MSADCRAADIPYGIYANVNGFLPFDDTHEWGKARASALLLTPAIAWPSPPIAAAYTERILDCARRYHLGEITLT